MRVSLRILGMQVIDLEVDTGPDEVDSRSLESVVLRDDSFIDPEVDEYAEAILHRLSSQKRPTFGFR